jgi:TetR/AcrR family transcriptional repressor of nem operon
MVEKKSHKERTRERIIDETAKAMREHGSEGLGVAALMGRAGLTHGGFYAHFEDRDDLVTHAIDRMFEDSRGLLRRYLDGAKADDGLRSLIDGYLSDRARRTFERGCPIPVLSQEAHRLPGAAGERFHHGVLAFREGLRNALAAIGSHDPDALSWSLLSEMVGAMSLARAVKDEEIATEILRASREDLTRRLGLTLAPEQPGNEQK